MLRKSLVLCGALLASLSISQQAAAAGKIGKVVAIAGSPSASGPGGSRSLKAGSEVFEDDRIVVKTGNAQILLDDNTRLVVGPGSTLLLDQFVKKDNRTASKVAIKALRGTYRFITGRSPKAAYKITTAHATIGIRGTGFDFWVKKKTGAAVLSGAVRLRGFSGPGTNLGANCEVGEATSNSSKQVKGTEKRKIIQENLPFLIDQSRLRTGFRLNIERCRVAPATFEGSSDREQEQPSRDNQDQGGTDTPPTGGTDTPPTGGTDNPPNPDGGNFNSPGIDTAPPATGGQTGGNQDTGGD